MSFSARVAAASGEQPRPTSTRAAANVRRTGVGTMREMDERLDLSRFDLPARGRCSWLISSE